MPGPRFQNRLLESIAQSAPAPWMDGIESVELAADQMLCDAQGYMPFAYFPQRAVLAHFASAVSTGGPVALTGCDGFVASLHWLDAGHPGVYVSVMCAGACYRVPTEVLLAEFEKGGAVLRGLMQYTQALTVQMAQIAFCKQCHSALENWCRWLLMATHSAGAGAVRIAPPWQDRLSSGVVSTDAGLATLLAAGAVGMDDGHVVVLDVEALKAQACSCFTAVQSATSQNIAG